MTPDEIAESFREPLANLHDAIEALPDGQMKTKAQHKLALAHEALTRLRDHFAESGVVQPFSGGDPKPPPPPAP